MCTCGGLAQVRLEGSGRVLHGPDAGAVARPFPPASRVSVKAALSTTTWVILFALPIIAIIAIVAFAAYHSSEVRKDGRDDGEIDE